MAEIGSHDSRRGHGKYIVIVTELFPSWAAGSSSAHQKNREGISKASSSAKGTMGPVFSSFIDAEEPSDLGGNTPHFRVDADMPHQAEATETNCSSHCCKKWVHLQIRQKYDGLYLIEIDRILRPGGYWTLSGPPVHWKKYCRGWERTQEDLKEQDSIEEVARRICWNKVIEKEDLAIWQKPMNRLAELLKSILPCSQSIPLSGVSEYIYIATTKG